MSDEARDLLKRLVGETPFPDLTTYNEAVRQARDYLKRTEPVQSAVATFDEWWRTKDHRRDFTHVEQVKRCALHHWRKGLEAAAGMMPEHQCFGTDGCTFCYWQRRILAAAAECPKE